MTVGDAFVLIRQDLQAVSGEREAAAIADLLLEHITGLSRLDRILYKERELTKEQESEFSQARERLLNGEPLQYVTGIQWFLSRPFRVSPQVLIPRPETEELVHWIVEDHEKDQPLKVIDIGTGSGCIPVSLKLELPATEVMGIDLSEGALEMAKQNTASLGAVVDFRKMNFLNDQEWEQLDRFDIIISNPPYIPLTEKASMDAHVKDHEPSMALFVEDSDPLIFYRHIAMFGNLNLEAGGAVYCEIHRDSGPQVVHLFREAGYAEVVLRQDIQGNDRMIRARK